MFSTITTGLNRLLSDTVTRVYLANLLTFNLKSVFQMISLGSAILGCLNKELEISAHNLRTVWNGCGSVNAVQWLPKKNKSDKHDSVWRQIPSWWLYYNIIWFTELRVPFSGNKLSGWNVTFWCCDWSAGCGRTGVLCVIDYTWNLLKKRVRHAWSYQYICI